MAINIHIIRNQGKMKEMIYLDFQYFISIYFKMFIFKFQIILSHAKYAWNNKKNKSSNTEKRDFVTEKKNMENNQNDKKIEIIVFGRRKI